MVQKEMVAVQDLFESGKTELPKEYLMPDDKIPIASDNDGTGDTIPVVDMMDMKMSVEQRVQVIDQICKACQEWGFFQVVNHGIDTGFLKECQDVSRAFFALPREEKLKYAAKKFGFGEDGYGSKSYTAEDAKRMWRDFFLICTLPLESRNLDNWPAQPSNYKQLFCRLSDEFALLAQRILEMLSEGLNLPSNYIVEKLGNPTQSILTNYYPACPEPDKVLGFVPHSDFGGLTLLLQDTTPGLQVLKNGCWVTAKPIPGAITVNISDLVELMSNGRYLSVTHRVRVNESKPRMSIASNYSCSWDTTIEPSPELIDEDHPQLYKPVKFGEYIKAITEKGPLGKSYMFLN